MFFIKDPSDWGGELVKVLKWIMFFPCESKRKKYAIYFISNGCNIWQKNNNGGKHLSTCPCCFQVLTRVNVVKPYILPHP